MQMMNKAIEDAADFGEFQRKLMQEHEKKVAQHQGGIIEALIAKEHSQPQRRPGENREQYRARIFGKAKA